MYEIKNIGEQMDSCGYYIDLDTFSLETLRERLGKIHMTPSQKILLDDVDIRFTILKEQGIDNLQQLKDTLKNKKAVQVFAEKTGLPTEYLTVLRRWVNGYLPKPIKLSDLPGVPTDVINILSEMGLKDTLQLFPHVKTSSDREELSTKSGIPADMVLLLAKFTDLARLKWVGPKFARLLIVSGYDTVEKVAQSDGKTLYEHLQKVKVNENVYQGGFSEDDIDLWVQHIVCDVPISIVF